MTDTRREFIKKATLLTGAVGLFSILPDSIQKALAINAEKGSTYLDAEHIVFLMQENRSFDHCYGTLQGVRGFDDPRAMKLPNQNKVWMQTNKIGETYIPFNLDLKNSKATWMQSLPHSWDNQVDARNKGMMDGWLESKKSGNKEYEKMPLTMGYYDRNDIPFYYALADAFTVCDQNFCSALTGTSANRVMYWSGKLREEDSEQSPAKVYNGEIDHKNLNWKTYPERLEEAGVSWKVYQNELSIGVGLDGDQDDWLSNFTDNDLEFFKQYNVRLHKAHREYLPTRLAEVEKTLRDLKQQEQTATVVKEIEAKKEEVTLLQTALKEWTEERFNKLSNFEKNIHKKAAPGLVEIRQYGYPTTKPIVNATLLKADITRDNLLAGAQQLEDFAYDSEERNRFIGTPGHNDTIYWLKDTLESLDGYYTVSLQEFFTVAQINGTINAFTVDGATPPEGSYLLFDYSASGNATAPLVPVSNLGCNAVSEDAARMSAPCSQKQSDYPATVSGNIALISRGSCEFGLKSALAGAAGAVGALIYNNVAGPPLQGTLGAPPRPEGDYVASISISQELGAGYLSAISGGANVSATIDVLTDIRNISTYNVLATTNSGDQENKLALGAHTDSVAAGPGINDDGSGTVGILEVAKALSKYKVNNAVTFGFWAAEEEGLLGSTYYVENLPATEAAKIRAYLNFDMIASPNFVNAIYDGDGSAFNLSGPAGSAEIETFFEDYFTGVGQNFTATAFDGRSDYGPFLDVGIPSGGLFTGAEENKTEEEVLLFGGTAGVALDQCYHQACDNVTNLDLGAFETHAKAIADAVATYSFSWEGFPARNTTATKRSVVTPKRTTERRHRRNKRVQPLEK